MILGELPPRSGDSVKQYLVDLPCRFCSSHQSHKYIANVVQEEEKKLEAILDTNALALVETLTQRILDIVPPRSTIISLGRSPILLGHMLRIGAHLGFRHCAMLNVVHLHFSGKPLSTLNFDSLERSASALTPEEYSFYFDYFNKQNFSPSARDIYIVDVLTLGQSMNSFLSLFSHFWKDKFNQDMPSIKILNMLPTEESINDFIEVNLETPFKDDFGALHYDSIDQKPWLRNIKIIDLLPQNLLELSVKDSFDIINNSITLSQTFADNNGYFYSLFNRLVNDDLQQAGGIYFPNKYWNQNDSQRLFNKEVSPCGRLQMQQIIDLMHAMCLHEIRLVEQYPSDKRFEPILDKIKQYLAINAFHQINYRIPDHTDFQPVGVKRKGY